jgi:hypothetical protein
MCVLAGGCGRVSALLPTEPTAGGTSATMNTGRRHNAGPCTHRVVEDYTKQPKNAVRLQSPTNGQQGSWESRQP